MAQESETFFCDAEPEQVQKITHSCTLRLVAARFRVTKKFLNEWIQGDSTIISRKLGLITLCGIIVAVLQSRGLENCSSTPTLGRQKENFYSLGICMHKACESLYLYVLNSKRV